MNIYENNKQLLTVMGGDSYNLATDYEVRKAILDTLGGDSSICSNIYEVDKQILKIYLEGGGGTSGGGEKAKVLTLYIDDSCIVDGTWGAESIDTSLMTDMSQMFNGCSSLQSLDVSGWDTSKVTDISSMFKGCSSLQSLDVSGWDTSNVTTMNTMFYHCSSLTQLDVSNWDTSNVTNISYMFIGCSSLQSLDVSGWDVSNVTNIDDIFYNCNKLTTLIGGRTIDEVISNNISALNGLKIYINLRYTILDRASLRALINGLANLSSTSSQPLYLGSTLIANLTEEDIAIATAKNWTISV